MTDISSSPAEAQTSVFFLLPGPAQIGTAGSTLGFYGAAGITEYSSADLGTITDSTGGTKSKTFAAITAGASYAQADMVAVKNALAQIAATLNAAGLAFGPNGVNLYNVT